MKITIARTAGFCMGVRRAVELVLDAPSKQKEPIYTYGPLIHNPQVLSLLEEKGITALTRIPKQGKGTVLIRAHGVPPEVKADLKQAGFTVVDATCPRVIKVQTIIRKHARKGYASIIIGDRDHPEVVGLLGYAKENGHVVDNLKDLEALPHFKDAIVVVQTTQNRLFFQKVRTWVEANRPHYRIYNTICDSTEKRQVETDRLSKTVDAIVVVGGRNSGNTQRLVEIAGNSGKPTYHVETETELDEALAAVQNVGITAGASTPNWVLKRVYRALESLPFRKGEGWRRVWFNLQRTLLLTSIYLGLGAGALCYANTRLLGIKGYLPLVLISILYVQSMHILNNLIGRNADKYNDPDRASFYETYKRILTLFAMATGGAGLVVAFTVGPVPFIILLSMSITGLSYNIQLLPNSVKWLKYRSIRDIPGSKTVLIAMAWGMVTSVFPSLFISSGFERVAVVFLWAAGLVFVRTGFFDILDMQGDRIVGKETIPILLGEKRAAYLLKAILIAIGIILLLSSLFRVVPVLGFILLLCPLALFVVLLAYEKGQMLPGIRLEFLVDTHFILAGILTGVWAVLGG